MKQKKLFEVVVGPQDSSQSSSFTVDNSQLFEMGKDLIRSKVASFVQEQPMDKTSDPFFVQTG